MNAVEETIRDVDEAVVEIGRTFIWKARDVDYPVTIVGELEVGPEGRRYVSVSCASTGIPLDESSEDVD